MNRKDFIQIAINDPKKAAKILRTKANKLENSKNITEVARNVSKTLFISDRTVFRDCKK